MSFNIIKHLGKIKKIVDPRTNKSIDYQDKLIFVVGDNQWIMAECVPDDDHMLYQFQMPVTPEELTTKYGGKLPKSKQGPLVSCSCGSEAVLLIEGPFAGKLICRAYAQFGKHQTSFKMTGGKLELDSRTKDSIYLSDKEILRSMKDRDDA